MKRIVLVLICMGLISNYSFAQGRDVPVGDPDATKIGIDSAQQELIDVTVSLFEEPGYWQASMPGDMGIITILRKAGEPQGKAELDKERMEAEANIKAPKGQYVLGVKVKFYKRALTSFSIIPVKPLVIPGKCKTISVWTVGRNFNHKLKVIVEDYYGKRHELTMSKLNFLGWKKLTVAVPSSIVQSDYHHTSAIGIKLVGFRVYCDLLEAIGTFFLYFDDLSAVTDLFEETRKDTDDMSDDW